MKSQLIADSAIGRNTWEKCLSLFFQITDLAHASGLAVVLARSAMTWARHRVGKSL